MGMHDGNTGWFRALRVNQAVDPGSVAANAVGTTNITVQGAKVGDGVILTPTSVLGVLDVSYYGIVSAANTVQLVVVNPTAGAKDIASQVWNVVVIQSVA